MGVYIGERSTSVELRWAHEGGGAPKSLGFNSKSPGFLSVQERSSRRFHSVWTPFGIPFLQNSKICKKTETGTGPSVNRLVPKII